MTISENVVEHFVIPEWPAPASVVARVTTRQAPRAWLLQSAEVEAPYGFNLATHVNDDNNAVRLRRQCLSQYFSWSQEPYWLTQVHGTEIGYLPHVLPEQADAIWTDQKGFVCAVLTADCLPIIFCDKAGTRVAAVHAGWRGLYQGIIGKVVAQLRCPGEQLMAWLGPGICQDHYQVGDEIYRQFSTLSTVYDTAFIPSPTENRVKSVVPHWQLDLYQIARIQLQNEGVEAIYGGQYCTFQQDHWFYSYRRQQQTGRMATLIWLDDPV